MSATDDPVSKSLLAIEAEMRRIEARDTDPLEAGLNIWSEAFSKASLSPDLMWPLWLLWGALTDWVQKKPQESELAHEAMHRASREWLTTAKDESSLRGYFDKWLYEEMGYERP